MGSLMRQLKKPPIKLKKLIFVFLLEREKIVGKQIKLIKKKLIKAKKKRPIGRFLVMFDVIRT